MRLITFWISLLSLVLVLGCSSTDKQDDAGTGQDADAMTGADEEPDAGQTDDASDAGDIDPADEGEDDAGQDGGPGDEDQPDAGDQQPPDDWLSQEYLMFVTTTLAADDMEGRETNTPGGIAARNFLIEQIELCGLPPLDPAGYGQDIATGNGVNLLGKISGSALPDRHVLISAHYDHLGKSGSTIYNGAYDNASAVALVLGVACTLVENPPERSVLVALWDAEEPPNFLSDSMGSEFYAANPVVPLEQTDVAVVLDLIGEGMWPGYQGHFILGAESSPQLGDAFQATSVPAGLDVYLLGLHAAEEQPFGHSPVSDYDAFRNRSIPALFLTDAYTKRYHTANDTIDFIDAPKLAREGQLLYNLTLTLANASQTPVWDHQEDYLRDVETGLAALEQALAPGGMVDGLGLNSTSQSKMQQDLTALETLHDKLSTGGTVSSSDIETIRGAVQRIMCLAGPFYSEAICALL